MSIWQIYLKETRRKCLCAAVCLWFFCMITTNEILPSDITVLLQTPGKLRGAASPRKERLLAQLDKLKENVDVSSWSFSKAIKF